MHFKKIKPVLTLLSYFCDPNRDNMDIGKNVSMGILLPLYILSLNLFYSNSFFPLSKNIQIKLYNSTFTCIWYGSKTLSLTLKEKLRLKMFKYRIKREIFGHREPYNLDSSPHIIRIMKSSFRLKWRIVVESMWHSNWDTCRPQAIKENYKPIREFCNES
jgi:hypothetical protein